MAQKIINESYLSGSIDEDKTLSFNESPYSINGSLEIEKGVKLIIEPGVVINNTRDYTILVKGGLEAIGTLAKPIVFNLGHGQIEFKKCDRTLVLDHCSVRRTRGSVNGAIKIDRVRKFLIQNIKISDGEVGVQIIGDGNGKILNSVFDNVQNGLLIEGSQLVVQNNLFKNCGLGLMVINGKPSITGCLFQECSTAIFYEGGKPEFHHNKFKGCYVGMKFGEFADNIELDDNIFENCKRTFAVSGNFNEEILSEVDKDVYIGFKYVNDSLVLKPLKNGNSYILDSILVVRENAVLIIKPGVSLKFDGHSYLNILGSLIANGEDSSHIMIQPLEPSINSGGIYFSSSTKNSLLNYVDVLHYSGFGKSGIAISGDTKIHISNCMVSDGYCGFWNKGNAELVLEQNYIVNNKIGVYVSSGNPKIIGNCIYNNVDFGFISSSNDLLILRNNFWGDKTGPEHKKINSEGNGNEIVGSVLLNPWWRQNYIGEELDVEISDLEVSVSANKDNSVLKVNLSNGSNYELKTCLLGVWINEELVTEFEWLGSLEPYTSEVLDLLNYEFKKNVEYIIDVRLSYPNGLKVNIDRGNRLRLELNKSTPEEFVIGKDDGDYESISDGLIALEAGDLGSNVVFLLTDGVYNEEILLRGQPQKGLVKKVLFRSKSGDRKGVVINGSELSQSLVELEDVENIEFRDLSFDGSLIEGVDVVSISPESRKIQFNNCLFEGKIDTGVVVQCLGENITLSNSLIKGGKTGVFCYSVIERALKDIHVVNNTFEDQKDLAIGLRKLVDPQVIKNRVVNRNKEFTGIDLRECIGFLIHGNRVVLKADGTAVSIYEGGNNDSTVAQIFFNEIIVDGLKNAFATGLEIGQYAGSVTVMNNSIKISGENTSSTAAFIENDQKAVLKNNNFSNYGLGYALFIGQSIETNEEPIWVNRTMGDNNNYFSKGDRIIGCGPDYSSLIEWQLSSEQDKKSLSVYPKFESSYSLQSNQFILDRSNYREKSSAEKISSYDFIGAFKVKSDGVVDLEVKDIILPVSSCDRDSKSIVKIEIANSGDLSAAGFRVLVKIDNQLKIDEYVGDVVVKARRRLVYELHNTINLTRLGEYKIEVGIYHPRDSNFSNNSHSNDIEVNEALNIVTSPDTTVCKGTYLSLKANGADNYSWSNGSKSQKIKVKINSDTVFYVVGEDNDNCSGEDSVSISLNKAFKHTRELSLNRGDSILLGGEYRFEEGLYIDTISTRNWCDSIIKTTLSLTTKNLKVTNKINSDNHKHCLVMTKMISN